MKKEYYYGILPLALTSCLVSQTSAQERQINRPNVVFIYADDIGYGDLSCNGAKTIHTPNVERLAKMGVRFTNAHSAAATSTPSRYAMLTGEYAWRKEGTGIADGDAASIIRPERYTMADMFLFPTTYDTNGIVVREAAACGLGSVLINGSCAAEGIEDRRNGYLIDENAPSMAEAVKDLIANIDLAHKIGENAMNEIYIPWDESVRKAYERYKAVIAKYKSPEYERNSTFTDDALNSIAGICDALNKARKFRESVTNGFIDRSLAISGALIEKKNSGISYAGTHLENIKNGFAVKKAVFEKEMEERKSMLAERHSWLKLRHRKMRMQFWEYFDRYL